jgi:hypothetical protein
MIIVVIISNSLGSGFYADQRDSRQIIRQLAAGKRVLDLCTYSGGFAISAALGGASSAMGREGERAMSVHHGLVHHGPVVKQRTASPVTEMLPIRDTVGALCSLVLLRSGVS